MGFKYPEASVYIIGPLILKSAAKVKTPKMRNRIQRMCRGHLYTLQGRKPKAKVFSCLFKVRFSTFHEHSF